MKRLAAALALSLAASLPAAAAGDDALALVPADAASVGVIHVADLRTSPLAARVFSDTDKLTVDGDAGRFLDEARLNPKEDVDTVVAAGSPRSAGGSAGWGLVLFEGRFDPAALSAAIAARGAEKKSTPAGDYFLLDKSSHNGRNEQAAIAFASPHLVIAGNESSVVTALAQRAAGGTAFRSGAASAATSAASTPAPPRGPSWTSRGSRSARRRAAPRSRPRATRRRRSSPP
jgi:hypothetical protein